MDGRVGELASRRVRLIAVRRAATREPRFLCTSALSVRMTTAGHHGSSRSDGRGREGRGDAAEARAGACRRRAGGAAAVRTRTASPSPDAADVAAAAERRGRRRGSSGSPWRHGRLDRGEGPLDAVNDPRRAGAGDHRRPQANTGDARGARRDAARDVGVAAFVADDGDRGVDAIVDAVGSRRVGRRRGEEEDGRSDAVPEGEVDAEAEIRRCVRRVARPVRKNPSGTEPMADANVAGAKDDDSPGGAARRRLRCPPGRGRRDGARGARPDGDGEAALAVPARTRVARRRRRG